MFGKGIADLFLVGAFLTITLTVVAVSFGYTLVMFVGLVAFFLFVYLWLTTGLGDRNGGSTSI